MTCLYSVVSVLTSVQICFQLRRSYTTSVYLDACSVALEASKKVHSLFLTYSDSNYTACQAHSESSATCGAWKVAGEASMSAYFSISMAVSNASMKTNIRDMITKRWKTNGYKHASGLSSLRLPNFPHSWYCHPTSCNLIVLMQRRGNGSICRRRA